MIKSTPLRVTVRLLAFLLLLSSSQATLAQKICGNSGPKKPSTNQRISGSGNVQTCNFASANCTVVRVFFHLVNHTNGSGGQSANSVPQFMSILNNAFAPRGIYFQNAGIDNINDDQYYAPDFRVGGDSRFDALTRTQVVGNAINAYLLGDASNYNGGTAAAVVSKAFVLGGLYLDTSTPVVPSPLLAHEMGHCLGLYHTFDEINGPATASNACSAGDLVADTNPENSDARDTCDPNTCTFPRYGVINPYDNSYYRPTPRNFMDYIPLSCMTSFTSGQGNRMKYFLINDPVLTPVMVNTAAVPTFTSTAIPSVLCLNNSQSFQLSINAVADATGYQWSVSPAGVGATVVTNGGTQATVNFIPGNYTVTVQVTANYSFCGSSMPATQQVGVRGLPILPTVTQSDPEGDRNHNEAHFIIDNFGAQAAGVTYTINNIKFGASTTPHPTRANFLVKGGYGSNTDYTGSFSITATNDCGSVTTDPFTVYYLIGPPPGARSAAITSYPNPTTEYFSVPATATQAVLLNALGQEVQRVDTNYRIRVQQLPAGIYYLRMNTGGKAVTQRVEVKH